MKNFILLIVFFILSQVKAFGSVDLLDTLFSKQWGLVNRGQIILRDNSELGRDRVVGKSGIDINWTSIGDSQIKASEVIVAVIDTGVDINHPDLVGRIWKSDKCKLSDQTEIACEGFDFLSGGAKMVDNSGHGTHVAGIIAANQNEIGVAGVTHPRVKIMPIRVLGPEVTGFYHKLGDRYVYITDIIADGIEFAVENGADVINLSIGWPQIIETPKMKKAIRLALDKQIPVIAAAGNNNKEVLTFPCTIKGVICVGAVDSQGELLEFSNFGGKIDILAPGEFIASTYPQTQESSVLRIRGYEVKNGTSQAAPFISAIAASLKLIEPEITLDALKGKLFGSARMIVSNTSDKFTSAGLVDMNASLNKPVKYFAKPIFKDLMEVIYHPEHLNFRFILPVKNYLAGLTQVRVKLSLQSDDSHLSGISLDKLSFDLNKLASGEEINLPVSGKILDLRADSHYKIKVELSSKEFKQSFITTLVFSKNLALDNSLIRTPIKDIDPKQIAKFGKLGDKATNLISVAESFFSDGPEYYFIDPSSKNSSSTTINFLQVHADEANSKAQAFKVENIQANNLVKFETILEVVKVDMNFDGQKDYLIYGIAKTPVELERFGKKIFTFLVLDKHFKPLLGDSSLWYFPITHFVEAGKKTELLSFKRGRPDFSWMKYNSKEMGPVMIPVMKREWYVPDEDNSLDPLTRFPLYANKHAYYLKPVKADKHIVLQLRVLDSFDFHQKIKKELKLNFDDAVSIEAIFSQDRVKESKGEISTLLAVGREFDKRYYHISFTDAQTWSIDPLKTNRYTYLAGNGEGQLLSLRSGDQLQETAFVALYQRDWVRMSIVNPVTNQQISQELKTDSWQNPIFTYLTGFKDDRSGDQFLVLESRHYLYGISTSSSDGARQIEKLPVNRDSSFPGAQFGEAFLPVLVQDSEQSSAYPGIFVDSTLIFGNRLYTMARTEKGWVRPIGLSVDVASNCIRLRSAAFGASERFAYAMLCLNAQNQLEFQFYPLELGASQTNLAF